MTFALDISPIVYGTGVSMYCKELVTALNQIDQTNHYKLFAGVWSQKQHIYKLINDLKLGPNFSFETVPLPPRAQAKLWNDWHVGKLEYFIGSKFNLYHSLDWSLAPTSKPTLLTVHDLFFLKRPDLQQHPYHDTLLNRLLHAKQKNLPVIAVSQATKNDLIELLGYPSDVITVIYEAIGSSWQPTKNITQLRELRSDHKIKSKYLIMIGTREPRKNLDRTIQAFTSLNLADVTLVIVGKAGWGSDTKPADNVVFTGYLPDDQLNILISSAYAMLYPSLHEGFGLPILQAFLAQIPILTSNTSSMPEVGGDAALYADPFDIDSLQDGISRLLTLTDKQLKERLKLGTLQLSKFSWEKTARQTLHLYSSLI